MTKVSKALSVLSIAVGFATAGVSLSVSAEEPTLSKADFDKAQLQYFQRCAGCHGVLRKGATGKSLEPEQTLKKGQKRLEKIIAYGTEGGMNNFDDIFSKKRDRQSCDLYSNEAAGSTRDVTGTNAFAHQRICRTEGLPKQADAQP